MRLKGGGVPRANLARAFDPAGRTILNQLARLVGNHRRCRNRVRARLETRLVDVAHHLVAHKLRLFRFQHARCGVPARKHVPRCSLRFQRHIGVALAEDAAGAHRPALSGAGNGHAHNVKRFERRNDTAARHLLRFAFRHDSDVLIQAVELAVDVPAPEQPAITRRGHQVQLFTQFVRVRCGLHFPAVAGDRAAQPRIGRNGNLRRHAREHRRVRDVFRHGNLDFLFGALVFVAALPLFKPETLFRRGPEGNGAAVAHQRGGGACRVPLNLNASAFDLVVLGVHLDGIAVRNVHRTHRHVLLGSHFQVCWVGAEGHF